MTNTNDEYCTGEHVPASWSPEVGSAAGKWDQMKFLLEKSRKLKFRNKLLTAAEILLPIYAILFMLMIFKLNIIPFEVVRTPASMAQPRHSIFARPIPTAKEMTDKEKEALAKYKLGTDPIRIGVAPADTPQGSCIAQALCKSLQVSGVEAVFGDGSPCFGVKMFADGSSLYRTRSRFDNIEGGLDLGFIVDENRRNFTIVHHESMLLNASTGEKEESGAVQNGLLQYQALISSALSTNGAINASAGVLQPSPASAQRIVPYLQEFPTAENETVINIIKWIFSFQFIQVLMMNFMGPMIRMAQEKEKGIKNALLLKGMSPLVYWATWFISESVTILLSALVCTCMIYTCQLMRYVNFGLVFVTFFLFGLSNVALAFVVSFCAEKAHTLAMFGALFNMLCIAAYVVVQVFMINKGVAARWVAITFLLPPVPFGHIIYDIYEMEVRELAYTPGASSYGPLAYTMLAVDLFVWMVVCLVTEYNDELRKKLRPQSADLTPDSALAAANGIVVRGLKKTFVVSEKVLLVCRRRPCACSRARLCVVVRVGLLCL
jgi:hypothetical protein